MSALVPLVLWLAAAAPTRWVTDEAGVLSTGARQALDSQLEQFERATGHQVIVYVDRSTHGVPIEDWAVRAFNEWKVGRAGLDDGAVLFVFVDDRAARIEVGYGLEDKLTDAQSSRIMRQVLAPQMAAGNVDGAVLGAVEAMLAIVGGQAGAGGSDAVPVAQISRVQKVMIAVAIALFLGLAIWKPHLALMMLAMLTRRGGRGGRGWGGGGFGGGGFGGGGGRSGGGGATGRW